MPDIILNTTPLPHLLTLVILLPLAGVAMMVFVKDEAAVKHVAFWTTGFNGQIPIVIDASQRIEVAAMNMPDQNL